MSLKKPMSIKLHEQVMDGFNRLTYLCSNEGSSIDTVLKVTHKLGRDLDSARKNGYDGIIRQATQQAQRLYVEAAMHRNFVFGDEEWAEMANIFSYNLPIPDHNALRFFLGESDITVRRAMDSYIAGANVFESYTLKQDVNSLCSMLAAGGRYHGEPAMEFVSFLASVSKSSPQTLPPANVVYAITAYYGNLKESIGDHPHQVMGTILEDFLPEVSREHTTFDTPRVEDVIGLYNHGYQVAAEQVALKCFPKSNSMKYTSLLNLERETTIDLAPLVERIKNTQPSDDTHVQYTGLLVTHFLASKNPLLAFSDLNLNNSKASQLMLQWIETVLVDYRDTLNNDNLKTTLNFILEHRPNWLAQMKNIPPIRDFLKNFDGLAADILAEDLGL